jgi:hypothetical protein
LSFCLYRARPIQVLQVEKSGLSKQFQEIISKEKDQKSTAGKIKLTIYLPDTESMKVYAPKNCTFGQLIEIILKEHENQEIQPPLEYDQLGLYELRIHESDGEPDRDFAALDAKNFVKDFNLGDEYCLCEIEREDSDFGPTQPAYKVQSISVNESLFSPSQFGTINTSRTDSNKNSTTNLLYLGGDGMSKSNYGMDKEGFDRNKFGDEDNFFDSSSKVIVPLFG